MKRKEFICICLALAVLSLSGCTVHLESDYKSLFTSREDVCLLVGHKDMIDFTSGPVQMECNPVKHTYRGAVCVYRTDVQNKTEVELVKDYYTLILDKTPAVVGDKLNGKLYLRTTDLNRSYDDMEMEVVKMSDSLAWIWCEKSKLGITVRICASN